MQPIIRDILHRIKITNEKQFLTQSVCNIFGGTNQICRKRFENNHQIICSFSFLPINLSLPVLKIKTISSLDIIHTPSYDNKEHTETELRLVKKKK